jgi:ribosomal protein S27AE
MADNSVIDRVSKEIGARNKNIDGGVAVALSESAFGAAALAEHVDDEEHAKTRGSRVRDTNRPRDPKTAANEDQAELLTDVKAIFDEVEERGGVQPATALQMHPWPINATGPHNTGIVLPACPLADEFVPFTFKGFRRDFADRGGKFKVTPVWPITILRDFQRQHENWGGIVVYLGDRLPGQAKNRLESTYEKIFSALKKITDREVKEILQQEIEAARSEQNKADSEKLSDGEIKNLIVQANDRRILFYESMYQQAEQVAADPKENHRKITHMHRMIARWMHQRGRYSVLPRWVSETKPRDFVEKPCPKCGAAVDLDKEGHPKGFACVKCNYILDPIRAYEAGEIDAENNALKRATREQLDAIGLKDVLTLVEERADVKKPRGKGKSADSTPQT